MFAGFEAMQLLEFDFKLMEWFWQHFDLGVFLIGYRAEEDFLVIGM